MELTVWIQNDKRLVSPKVVNISRYTPEAIAKAYFGIEYPGAFSYADVRIPHCVVYTEPKKIGASEGSNSEWLYFPESNGEMKRMKKMFEVEPLPNR